MKFPHLKSTIHPRHNESLLKPTKLTLQGNIQVMEEINLFP